MTNDNEIYSSIRYISPTTDFGFKKLLGDKRIMKGFLNALFESKKQTFRIEDLDYIDKEASGTNSKNRGVIFDLKCKTSNNEEILIEMQNESQDFFENRIIYYMARAISNQGFKKGHKKKDVSEDAEYDTEEEWDFKIDRVIGIFMMNFYDPKESEKISRNCWVNTETGRITSDRQEYWKVQLPYFRSHNMKEEDCTSKSDYWLYNFANMGTMNNVAFKDKDNDFVYLSDLADFRSMSIPEQDRYIKTIDQEVVYNNVMDRRYRSGYADGEEKGIAKGLAQGMIEGSKAKEREMILGMLLNGFSNDTIAKIANIPIEEVERIKSTLAQA